jgi:hypothetical protein
MPITTTYVQQTLASNGSSSGYVVITDGTAFSVGAQVFLSGTGLTTQVLEISEIDGETIYLRNPASNAMTRFDCSSFTTAASSKLTQPPQEVPGQAQVSTDLGPGTSDYLSSNGSIITSHEDFEVDGDLSATGDLTVDGTITVGSSILAASGDTATLVGAAADGSSAVGVLLQNSVTLADAAAKLVSVKNNSSEKLYIDLNGAIVMAGALLTNSGASSLHVKGTAADASNAIGVILSNGTTLADSGAKLLQVKNNTTEKLYLDKDGKIYTAGALIQPTTAAATSMTIKGTVADGASAIAVILDNTVTLANAGAKIASFRQIGEEMGYVGVNGHFASANGVFKSDPLVTNVSATLQGNYADGASAVGVVLNNATTLTNASSRLLAVRNNGTDALTVDKYGGIHANLNSGGLALRCIPYPGFESTYTAIYTLPVATAVTTTNYLVATNGTSTQWNTGSGGSHGWNINGSGYLSLTTGSLSIAVGALLAGNSNTPLILGGKITDGASAIATKLYNQNTLSTNGAEIVGFYSDNQVTKKAAIDKDGKLMQTATGGAATTGTATLVGGTVTVSTTAVTTSSKIQLTRNTPGGTLGHLSVPDASIVSRTSFVINSNSGSDTSTVNWLIIN